MFLSYLNITIYLPTGKLVNSYPVAVDVALISAPVESFTSSDVVASTTITSTPSISVSEVSIAPFSLASSHIAPFILYVLLGLSGLSGSSGFVEPLLSLLPKCCTSFEVADFTASPYTRAILVNVVSCSNS